MRIPTAILLSVCALAMWVVDYVRMPEQWLWLLLTQGLILLNAGLLCSVLYRAKASAHLSLLPALLYILAMGIFPYLRFHWQPQLIAAILLFFLLATRDMSDTHEPNGLVFFVTILLCLTSLLIPDALWCVPLLWIVVLLQGAFTIRTILSSVLAVALIAIYYVLAMYLGWAELWDVSVLTDRQWLGNGQPACLTTTVMVMMAAFLVVTVCAFRRSLYDLVSTRMLLYHAALWGVLSLPLILLTTPQPDFEVMLPLTLATTSGIFLLQKESEARGITLLLYISGAIALYLWLTMSL